MSAFAVKEATTLFAQRFAKYFHAQPLACCSRPRSPSAPAAGWAPWLASETNAPPKFTHHIADATFIQGMRKTRLIITDYPQELPKAK